VRLYTVWSHSISSRRLIFASLQEELVQSAAWRYITDALTKEEALVMLKAKEAGKSEREALVRRVGQVSKILIGWLCDDIPPFQLSCICNERRVVQYVHLSVSLN
jgi:hypothetical protein